MIGRVFPLVFLVVAIAALACSTVAARDAASRTAAAIPRAANNNGSDGGGSSSSPATPVTGVPADKQSRAELLGLDASDIQTLLGRDAIRSIDDPEFVTTEVASQWMSDEEQVIGLDLDGVQRAYPLNMLSVHEIVNDVVNGRPIAVTF